MLSKVKAKVKSGAYTPGIPCLCRPPVTHNWSQSQIMKVIRHSMLPFRICVPSCYILTYLEMTSAFQGRAPDWPVSPALSTALESLLQVCWVTGPTYRAQVDSLAFSSGGRLIGIYTNPRVQWRGYHSPSSLMLLFLSVSHTYHVWVLPLAGQQDFMFWVHFCGLLVLYDTYSTVISILSSCLKIYWLE